MGNRHSKIAKKHAEEALLDCLTLSSDDRKLREFINDLLTETEKLKIGNRIRIALLLAQGYSFEEIMAELGVGMSTINRVSQILKSGRGGLFNVIKELLSLQQERLKKSSEEIMKNLEQKTRNDLTTPQNSK